MNISIPHEIIDAARLVEHWFSKQGTKDWQLGGIQSRALQKGGGDSHGTQLPKTFFDSPIIEHNVPQPRPEMTGSQSKAEDLEKGGDVQMQQHATDCQCPTCLINKSYLTRPEISTTENAESTGAILADIQLQPATLCCGYKALPSVPYPVMWNEFNKVVQCHNCGEVYEPKFTKISS